MRAIVVDSPGGPEALRPADLPKPAPGPGELLVRVAYAGCNWGDVQRRQGVYPVAMEYPAVLGGEVSGWVEALGEGAEGPAAGCRVAALTGPADSGGYAEYAAVPAELAVALPAAVPLTAAAAFPTVSLTAYHLLHTAHRLRAGETVLIHAIGGAVGLMATQMAVRIGARVLGTVGRPGKGAKALALGAHRVICREEEDFVAVALEETGGLGVDLVIDSLGADILPRSFGALRHFGRLINIGEAAGYPDFSAGGEGVRQLLYRRSTSFAGFELLHARKLPQAWRRGMERTVAWLAAGEIEVPIAAVMPLEQAAQGHLALESRALQGKLLFQVAPA